MLVFTRDIININKALHSTCKPYNPNTASDLPSHHGGEIGGSLEDLIISLLNPRRRETFFGNIGCGQGNFLFCMKLLE